MMIGIIYMFYSAFFIDTSIILSMVTGISSASTICIGIFYMILSGEKTQ